MSSKELDRYIRGTALASDTDEQYRVRGLKESILLYMNLHGGDQTDKISAIGADIGL